MGIIEPIGRDVNELYTLKGLGMMSEDVASPGIIFKPSGDHSKGLPISIFGYF